MDQIITGPASDNHCRVCLSRGRKMTALGQLKSIFRKITSNFDYQDYVLTIEKLCWECITVLKRVYIFQEQIQKSLETVQMGQVYYGTLSNLSTVILNDNHTHVYMSENDTKPDVCGMASDDDINECDNGSQNDLCDEVVVKSERIKLESPAESKKPKSNCWAAKKASQNKKPKFKIITNYTNDIFNKVQITNEDVSLSIKSERNSEYFKSKRHKCFKCLLTFLNDRQVEEHVKKYHLQTLPYKCDICKSRSLTKRQLAKHISKHYFKYSCTLCDFSCYTKPHRKWHHEKKHPRIFQCLKCKLKFCSRKNFFKHYKEWHEKFICDHCGISFKMKYCIRNHIRKQHSPFECKTCNKRFARYNGLWLHNKTIHSLDKTSAYCVECDRMYPDIYRYRWHLANSARHNRKDKRRVPCPGCEKVFTKNIYMKDHYNLVHLKFYKYRCKQCDKNFIRNADLVKHRRRIHEGILPPKNKICYQCGRGFTTNKILNQHVRTHTGERPHVCASCGARFAQSAALRAHRRALHAPAAVEAEAEPGIVQDQAEIVRPRLGPV